MGIGAILFLIIGIFFIILGILAVNHYRLHPEKEGALISILFPFILGIIGIMGAITGYLGLAILFLIINGVIFRIYTARKYPDMKKKQEESREKALEIYKKHPILYKLLRISRYMMYVMLACIIFLSAFIMIVVLFNITF